MNTKYLFFCHSELGLQKAGSANKQEMDKKSGAIHKKAERPSNEEEDCDNINQTSNYFDF